MMFSIDEIARATGGTVSGAGPAGVGGVSTDSRSVGADQLFVALTGERFDGHDFIRQTAQRGVRAFLVKSSWASGNPVPPGDVYVAVPDTLAGLGDLARYHRAKFDVPVVAVTGSNGKTTTKEMVAAILSGAGDGLKTSGNLNNLIGLPLTIFQLDARHQWAVLEMGMSDLGEIDRLAEIAGPDIGIITNALPAHLETLKTVENVAQAKGELFLRLRPGGVAVYNADDPLVSRLPVPPEVRKISFGFEGADVTATDITRVGRKGQRFTLRVAGTAVPVELAAFGRHAVANALAAAAAAQALGIGPEKIKEGLERFRPVGKRFSLEEVGELVLIDDSYNANPASMAAALVTLGDLREEGRAVAVLGDMLELGEGSASAHRNVGRLAASSIDRLYVMGAMAAEVAAGALEGGLEEKAVQVMKSHAEILADLSTWVEPGDTVLVKGSRGMGMEAVAEGIRSGGVSAARKGR